jgi:hypothetical protein
MTNEEKAFKLAEQVVKEKATYGTGYVASLSYDDCSIKLLSSSENKYEVRGRVKLIHPEEENIYKNFSIVVEFDDELMVTGDFWYSNLNAK